MIVFPADRVDQDIKDPDLIANAPDLNVDGAITSTDPGKAPVEHPLKTFADEDDDDCVVLEVYGHLPLLFENPSDPATADPNV
jgi:hypothetical protein